MPVSRCMRIPQNVGRFWTGSLLLLGAVSCSLRPYEFNESATDATSMGTTTTGAATGTSVAATSVTSESSSAASSAAGTEDSGSLVAWLDMGTGECGPWQQTCPEGQKCMPYSADGGSFWNSWGCFPLVPNPAGVDEPCMVIDSGVSGKDTCDEGLMCWYVDWDTGMGRCLAMCTGTPDAPTCSEPMTSCTISAEASLILCIPHCDPLAQDCTGGDLCIFNPNDPNSFVCVLDASGEVGQVFDACEYINACDPGLLCMSPELAVECDPMGLGCCVPFCDVSQPNTCPGQGQGCLPWYEMGMAPPGYENVGFCGVPPP